jgi:HAMP domain-containing protein
VTPLPRLGRRWWWITGAVLIVAAVAVSAIAPESGLAVFLSAIAWIWFAITLCLLAWRLWRWMTYRVGVRLFITYLLVGVLPLFFATAFAAIGLYIEMGQYTSVRVGSEFDRFGWSLLDDCEDVIEIASDSGSEAAFSAIDELASDPPDPLSRVFWWARIGDRTKTVGGDLENLDFEWLPEGSSWAMAIQGETTYSVTAFRSPSGDRVAALIPFDDLTASDLNSKWWFDVAFLGLDEAHVSVAEGWEDEASDEPSDTSSDSALNISIDGNRVSNDELWPQWTEGEKGFFSQPYVVWFRVVVDLVSLDSGEALEGTNQVALLRTSPRNVWDDFTLSRYELATELWGAVAALGLFFLFCYGLAMATSAAMILSITRSTSRLTVGARAIERGDLDYRVPVKRHDQLGDLARTFNHMSDSVQSMLSDVAEKERLARELELAREIQESLLPASYLEVGPISVRATFQPATEVGGDYFDVFPISEDKLVVAIGDVAGHGLSTGLLMASLKSSVAALVQEGYGGTDLIDKVNHLLMEHGRGRTMVTMSVVEIELAEGQLVLANAGHCPALLIHPDGRLQELLAGSPPMGSRLCRPASLESTFSVGSRLVLYSDGLVEAVSPAGEPFGYERLEDVVSAAAGLSGSGLTKTILDALAEHSDGVPAADDLTILVVERNASS